MLCCIPMDIKEIIDAKPAAFQIIERIVDQEVAKHKINPVEGNPAEGHLFVYLWQLINRISYLQDKPVYQADKNLSTGRSLDISESIQVAGILASFGNSSEKLAEYRATCLEFVLEEDLVTIEGSCEINSNSDAAIKNGDLRAVNQVLTHLDRYSAEKYSELRRANKKAIDETLR